MDANKKVTCIVLIYDNVEIIKRSIDSLMKYRELMDIHIIENPSRFTENYTKPAMLSLLSGGFIDRYVLFDKNITNNAIDIYLSNYLEQVTSLEYTLITDGDVVADGDWLECQMSVLNRHKDVFCASVQMSLEGWSDGLKSRFGKPISENSDYIEISSGIWLCLFRSFELNRLLTIFQKNKFRFRDGPIMRFISEHFRMKWVAVKNAMSYELTRSGYSNPNYRKLKNELIRHHGGIVEFWNHDEIAGFKVYEGVDKYNYYPPATEVDSFREEVEADFRWLIDNFQLFRKFDTLFFGINVKNRLLGQLCLGNSSSRSFYDEYTNTGFIRCNIFERLPDFDSLFACVNLYDLLAKVDYSYVCTYLNFSYKSLRPGGQVRFVIPLDFNANFSFDKLLNDIGYTSFKKVSYVENMDIAPSERYSNLQIFSAVK